MSEKKFTIKGYVKGQGIPVFIEETDSLEEAKTKAKDSFKKGNLERVSVYEEVKKREKGAHYTIQKDKEGKIEELEDWWFGEEETKIIV